MTTPLLGLAQQDATFASLIGTHDGFNLDMNFRQKIFLAVLCLTVPAPGIGCEVYFTAIASPATEEYTLGMFQTEPTRMPLENSPCDFAMEN